jgi:heme-degrading monooxygenase HmoA
MIVRFWQGQTTGENAEDYLRHITETVFPNLCTIDGYLGARVLRCDESGKVEFLILTQWGSWDAVRAFAGDAPDVAVVEPAARALLAEFDSFVRHFEVAYESNG